MTDQKSSEPTVEFTPPAGGFIATYLPQSLAAYVELTRMHIPPLNLVCYSPFVVGILLAALIVPASPGTLAYELLIAYPLAFLCGSFGHVIDDTIDYSIDRLYARCASRPIVRGAISQRSALAFAGVLFLLMMAVESVRYDGETTSMRLWWLCAFGLLAIVYPSSKRVTNFPQAVLAVLHGLPVPWMADSLGVVNITSRGIQTGRQEAVESAALAVMAMWIAFGTNTMIVDIGYGSLDAIEDAKHGVGSMALRFRHCLKTVLLVLSGVHLAALVVVGYAAGLGWVYHVGCFAKGIFLLLEVNKLQVTRADSTIDFFQNVSSVGFGIIVLSLLGEYIRQRM